MSRIDPRTLWTCAHCPGEEEGVERDAVSGSERGVGKREGQNASGKREPLIYRPVFITRFWILGPFNENI